MLQVIVSLLSGIAGGNIAGAILKKYSLGAIWNSILGLLGGGIGGEMLSMVSGGTLETGSILGSILSSAVGGGVLLFIVGFLKTTMAK